MNVVQAVMSWAVPPRYAASGIWKLMRDEQGVDMTGFYEARRRCDGDLYRLICHFDNPAPAPGKIAPAKALAIVHGYSKPDNTPARKKELEQAIDNWNEYVRTRKRSPAIVFPAKFCS